MDSGLFTRFSISPQFFAGEFMVANFEEMLFQGFAGENMKAEISILYSVKFLESGTLNNQYIAQFPDGSPDWANTFPQVASTIDGNPFWKEIVVNIVKPDGTIDIDALGISAIEGYYFTHALKTWSS